MKNNPNPSNKASVLIGCPNLVVQANALKSQPKMIAPTENSIFFFLVNVLVYCFKINVFMFRNNFKNCVKKRLSVVVV